MSQEIIRIETINTDVINVATTEVIKIEGVGLQGNSGDNVGVVSFNGRVGIVFPELDDYQASLITNDSSETGATVKDALDALDIEQGEQDTAIQGNKDSITGLDLRVTQNETDITTINLEQVVQDNRLDAIDAEQIVQNDKLVELDDNITAIEDTAVFESPVSPNPVNYLWLGNQFQYNLIGLNGGTYEDDTIYNVNDNLASLFQFTTQNDASISPNLSSTLADWSSVGSNEGVALGVSSTTFTYNDDSIEHTVQVDNFDNSNSPVSALLSGLGITSISSLSAIPFTKRVWLFNNTQLTELPDLDALTLINLELRVHACNLTGHIATPLAPSMLGLWLYSNPLLTSINSLIGNIALVDINISGCALDQTTVDMIFNEMDANGMSSGSINTSGGTNASVTSASLTARTNLIGRGVTLTFN